MCIRDRKKAICQILVDEGYIKGMKVTDDGKQGVITLTLKYQDLADCLLQVGSRNVHGRVFGLSLIHI